MCMELRERVFNDVGRSSIKIRCLDAIKNLKADADQLLTKAALDSSTAAQLLRDKFFEELKKDDIKEMTMNTLKKLDLDT